MLFFSLYLRILSLEPPIKIDQGYQTKIKARGCQLGAAQTVKSKYNVFYVFLAPTKRVPQF